MVVLLYPHGQPGIEAVGLELYATHTLHSMRPVNDVRTTVRDVLNLGLSVVIPDNCIANPSWSAMLTMLAQLNITVVAASSYLKTLTVHQPAAGVAAPPTQQHPAVGLTH